MHPAVQMKSLERLPFSIRRIASLACHSTASLEILERAKESMASPNISPAQRIAFLPVFFSHLDPARIPTPEQLEIFDPQTRVTVERAVSSLDAVFHIRVPKDAGSSLWPGVWSWCLFFHAHWNHLLGIELQPGLIFYTDFLLFAGTFHDDPPTSALMLSTPGFRAMVVKTWSFLPEIDEPNRLEMVLNDLSGFLIDAGAKDPANLAEMVSGAGGSLDDLASLIVKYIDTVIRRDSPLVPDANVYYIRGICSFICDADHYPVGQKQWLLLPLGRLSTTLHFGNFVEALVAAILSLSTSSAIDTGKTLNLCFMILGGILTGSSGYMWLEEALESGLIRCIVNCATLPCAKKINHYLRYLLGHVIPNGLINDYIVERFKILLREVKDLVSTDAFRTCNVFEHWERFVLLVEERLNLLAEFSAPDFVLSRACDNLECGYIDEKWCFERCSRCKAFYYCSPDCQFNDWEEGGHRQACRSYANLCLTELSHPKLVVRERAFIRFLVQADYEKHLRSICAKQVAVMVENPAFTLLLTLLNYGKGSVKIEVHSATDSPLAVALRDWDPEWQDMVARAMRSDGQLQLHIVQVYHGPRVQRWAVPLRCDSSAIFRGLRKLALTLSTDHTEEQIMEGIDSIRRAHPDVTEIH